MRIASVAVLLAFVSPASLAGTGCMPCGLADLDGAQQLRIRQADPGTYQVDVVADGTPLAMQLGVEAAGLRCSGACQVTAGRVQLSPFLLSDAAGLHLVLSLAHTDDYGGPRTIAVRVTRGAAVVVDRTVTATYHEACANGRLCGPCGDTSDGPIDLD